MKILVCVKAVPDAGLIVEPAPEGLCVRVDPDQDLRMNRFDAYAVEAAMRLREAFPDVRVDALAVGPEAARKVVRRAMGMGADGGMHILADYETACDAGRVSALIAAAARERKDDLILCGVMSEDMMQFSTGPMLARRLSLAWSTAVVEADLYPENRKIRVFRELEGGVRAELVLRLPALLTIQSGTHEPRYPSLSNLLRATDDRIQIIPAAELSPPPPLSRTIGYAYPEKKRAGRVLTGSTREKAEALIRILGEKGINFSHIPPSPKT